MRTFPHILGYLQLSSEAATSLYLLSLPHATSSTTSQNSETRLRHMGLWGIDFTFNLQHQAFFEFSLSITKALTILFIF